MINVSELDYNATILKPNTPYLVEDICNSFVGNLQRAYIIIATFNIIYSFTYPIFKKYSSIGFNLNLESGKVINIRIEHLSVILDTMFFMLNFFGMGYYLLLVKFDWFKENMLDLWFIRWLY